MTSAEEPVYPFELTGYTDRPSAAPGERISFHISTDAVRVEATVVRLIHGDTNGPGFKEEFVAELGSLDGRKQSTHPGSFVAVESRDELALQSFTIQMWLYPTTPTKGTVQGLLSKWSDNGGYAMILDERGHLGLWVGAGGRTERVTGEEPLAQRQWHFVAASVDVDTGRCMLRYESMARWPHSEPAVVERYVDIGRYEANAEPLLFAALRASRIRQGSLAGSGLFNGKIDAPALFGRALSDAEIAMLRGDVAPSEVAPADLIAAWDFSIAASSVVAHDVGPSGIHGVAINMPMRAVTGHNWSTRDHDFKYASSQYRAIHFHDDDLEDACWESDLGWRIPQNTRSGFYAVRLRADEHEDHIPFFVRPRRHASAHARVLVLAPTFTYLAYACDRLQAVPLHAQAYSKRVMTKDRLDTYHEAHPEFGMSLYDLHSDGSGCCYSSWRRPVTNMRPKYRQWQVAAPRHLGADLYLLDWLEARGIDYEVATDHDFDSDGRDLLEGFKVLITGTHPEYWSERMLLALQEYLDAGGRQMYLGGNGYYWVTGTAPGRPHVIEVRRGNAGTRAWNSEPGELYLSSSGEMGGLWRLRGRSPNAIAGIGFAAAGYDAPTPGYTRLPGSFDPRAAFIFEGIAKGETIGNFGLVLGGAAGDEIDRFNHALGTPTHAILLASAVGHDQSVYMPVVEDYQEMSNVAVAQQARTVSADLVYFETKSGGATFAAGAISWCGSLSHNNYDNNVSRVTENVLRAFLD